MTSEIPRSIRLLCAAIANQRLEVFKLRCAQCMSAFLRGARRGGAPSDFLLEEHLDSLAELAGLNTQVHMRRHLLQYAMRLSRQVHPLSTSPIERIVAGMLTDMAQTIDRPQALRRYATELELSRAHLSRSFSRIVGRSFRAEQQRLRQDRARMLLTTSDVPLSQISQRVGLQSVSQFISDFKRSVGLTPAAYRRRNRSPASS